MKKLKGIINTVKTAAETGADLTPLLWQLICYSPKMPLWLPQKQLLAEAEHAQLYAYDQYFTQTDLKFNVFKWGNGKRKILLTHGWASKAADFIEIIAALRKIEDTQIIAFDAPGNGSSEGELSNLLLYVEAIKAVLGQFGTPEVMIGHSLGVMANIIALNQAKVVPGQLISLTPLVRLQENFTATMDGVGVSKDAQEAFFNDFRQKFQNRFSHFNLTTLYGFNDSLPHFIGYDEGDQIAPFTYLQEFLTAHPQIKSRAYNGAGHDRILKNEQLIADVLQLIG